MKSLRFPILICLTLLLTISMTLTGQVKMENTAIEKTAKGDLAITPILHGSVMFQFNGKTIYVDPWSRADLSAYPQADLILITHDHRDHLDEAALKLLSTPSTIILGPKIVTDKLERGILIKNGERREIDGIKIETILAYNLVRERSPGVKYHPKGDGLGYIITFGDKRVYVAGDTEGTPEMKALKNIDIAFLPMNLPYTMTAEEMSDAVKEFKPDLLYPYHYSNDALSKLKEIMKDDKNIELRILKLSLQ